VGSLLAPVTNTVGGLPLVGGLVNGLLNPVVQTVDGLVGGLGVGGLLAPVTGQVTGAVDNLGLGEDDGAPLDLDEIQNVSSSAFKEAYDYYKVNAVGDPKTREDFLLQLRGELAEYEEDDGGSQSVTGGLLKSFTDENYSQSLSIGESVVDKTLGQLNQTQFPDFESFTAARERATADVQSQFQKNVAYPELSDRLLRGLEELSTKMQLQFNLSAAEKEKEQLRMQEARSDVEQQKKDAELQRTLMTTQQHKTNVEQEKGLLLEQNEKQSREWKARADYESKIREKQIVVELQSGFDDRAQQLRAELASSQRQTMQMMQQMQKESQASQASFSQLLMEQQKTPQPQPVAEVRKPGLLGSILAPVTGLVDGLLGSVL